MKKVLVAVSALMLSTNLLFAGQAGSGGVDRVYDGGNKSPNGSIIYIIKCNSGGSTNAFSKGGRWYDGSGFGYSDRYSGISINELAQELCN